MNCLSLDPKGKKQCLLKAPHEGQDHVFTLLAPEVAAASDKRKERDNQLVRRQVAQAFIPALITSFADNESVKMDVVDVALVLADDLIAKTGGFGP